RRMDRQPGAGGARAACCHWTAARCRATGAGVPTIAAEARGRWAFQEADRRRPRRMTLVYAESSAVLSWLLGEQQQDDVISVLSSADTVVTSSLTVLEC